MFSRIVNRYKDSVVVVIGAGGIGKAIVRVVADTASRVIVADCNPSLLDAIRTEVPGAPIQVRQIDVRQVSSVAKFFEDVKVEVGAPDFLFYTAGILNLQQLVETTPELWDQAVGINLNGAFYCVKAATELMIPNRSGSILLLGSIAGTKGRSGSRVNPVYNTTKAGLSSFVNAAAIQLRPFGIRINCISPGPTATSMMDLQPPQVHQALTEITLDGRQNDPTEVAELALFVAAHGRFTGEDLGLGGGAGLGG